ncbi:hypothetical protein GCM10011504_30030 [Siccirubricoccus deserti]|nr:hypothetical protein GCM10011504_30030 [Siccirubricoccus deserti]
MGAASTRSCARSTCAADPCHHPREAPDSGQRRHGGAAEHGAALVEGLTANGIETLYALPGVQNDRFFDALYHARDRLRVVYHPRSFLSTGLQGTLGWGFATALGVKTGCPDRPVLPVNGDGGFMFNVQELATAVQHGIATVSVVFNDGAYGNVKGIQKSNFGGRTIASELRNPDFVRLAESFGAGGLRATAPEAPHGCAAARLRQDR